MIPYSLHFSSFSSVIIFKSNQCKIVKGQLSKKTKNSVLIYHSDIEFLLRLWISGWCPSLLNKGNIGERQGLAILRWAKSSCSQLIYNSSLIARVLCSSAISSKLFQDICYQVFHWETFFKMNYNISIWIAVNIFQNKMRRR